MPRPAKSRASDDDPELPTGTTDDDGSPPLHRKSRHRDHRAGGRRGVKAWDDPEVDPADEDLGEEPGEKGGLFGKHHRAPVYFRARDSIWFEPLVALMIIVVLLVSLFAYTSNWPPMYVVESQSMQHGYDDQLGLINTGDLVLAQKLPQGSITPYIVGLQTGYSTYGEYGDVLLYHPDGDASVSPIIHRALLYLQHNADGSYDAPSLTGLSCGTPSSVYTASSSPSGCGTTHLTGTLTLHHVGWSSVDVNIHFGSINNAVNGVPPHSGFVTMGDNNFAQGNQAEGIIDQNGGISTLVEPDWVIGVARGMIPWFGALKLALAGTAQEVPSQSWQYLGITLVGVFLGALGLHQFLKAMGVEDERRKKREAEEERAGKRPSPGKKQSRWSKLKVWASDDDGEGADEGPDPESHLRSKGSDGPSADTEAPRGRPFPRIGRKKKVPVEDEEDL
jgi:signal peptidase